MGHPLFPLKDENPTEITSFVTVIIIAANVLVWVLVQNAGAGQGCSANPTFSRAPSPEGGGLELLSGPEATECALRRMELGPFRILHISPPTG